MAYYVTDVAAPIDDGASSETKSETNTGTDDMIAKHSGRPDLADIVREFCADPGTVAIASMSVDGSCLTKADAGPCTV